MQGGSAKPWLTAPVEDRGWAAMATHKSPFHPGHDFIYNLAEWVPPKPTCACILIQDANMGGSYYRVIFWYNNDPDSYFAIAKPKNLFYDTTFDDMALGSVVVDARNKQTYSVVRSEKYVKILEAV